MQRIQNNCHIIFIPILNIVEIFICHIGTFANSEAKSA
jgi:hypothetical protein